MLKKKVMVIGAALLAAVFSVVLIWNWNRTPNTFGLGHAASGDTPKASLRLLSPGILSIALESRNTRAAGVALQADGTIVVGATTSPKVVSAPAGDKQRGVVLRLTSNGRLANPAVTALANTPSAVSSVSTARDGTIVVVGYGQPAEQRVAGPAFDRHFLVARLLPNGELDPAFGGEGIVLANMRSGWRANDTAHGIAIEGDGRVVVTGGASYALGPLAAGSYCATARLGQDGHLDRSFGDEGRVLTLVPGWTRCNSVSVFVGLDGRIIVAGNASSERGPHHIVALRYLPSGALDPQFGRGGTVELQTEATAWSAALDAQSRILAVGTEWLGPTGTRILVARFDSHGNVDQSFGAGGTVSLHDADVLQELNAAAFQPDGKIAAVGTFGWSSATRPPEPGKRYQIIVLRLDASGALDTSFADGGLLLMASPRYQWGGQTIVIQPDGKLLIAGFVVDEADDRTSSIVLVRLNRDGTPDTEFGRDVVTP
jgi:uncharacterized delta-60 repeat protein